MKKTIMSFLSAMMIISLAACTPTTEKMKNKEQTQTETTAAPEKEKKNDGAEDKAETTADKADRANHVAADRPVDVNEPEMETVVVYTVKEDQSGLKGIMDSIEKDLFNAQALSDLLAAHGVLEAGTEVIDFTLSDEKVSAAAGPGVAADSAKDNTISAAGVLNLNQIPDEGKDELIVHAVARTFMECMNVETLTIQVNGETVADGLTAADVE